MPRNTQGNVQKTINRVNRSDAMSINENEQLSIKQVTRRDPEDKKSEW